MLKRQQVCNRQFRLYHGVSCLTAYLAFANTNKTNTEALGGHIYIYKMMLVQVGNVSRFGLAVRR